MNAEDQSDLLEWRRRYLAALKKTPKEEYSPEEIRAALKKADAWLDGQPGRKYWKVMRARKAKEPVRRKAAWP